MKRNFYADLHSHVLSPIYLSKFSLTRNFSSRKGTLETTECEKSPFWWCVRTKQKARCLFVYRARVFCFRIRRISVTQIDTALSLVWTVLHWTVKQYCKTSLSDHPKCDHNYSVRGNRSSRPKVISSELISPETRVMAPEIQLRVYVIYLVL